MVYESDFYTTRRPYSRPLATSYSVTSPTIVPLSSVIQVRTYPHLPYVAHKRLVTIVHTPIHSVYHTGTPIPIRIHSRVRPSVLAAEYNRIRGLPRTTTGKSYTQRYLNSRDNIFFDDETREIRAKAESLLRRIHVFVPRPSSSDYEEEILPERMRSDDYIRRILGARKNNVQKEMELESWYTVPEQRHLGKGNLACVQYVGGKPHSRRRPYYKLADLRQADVKNDVNLLSYYSKNRQAAANASPATPLTERELRKEVTYSEDVGKGTHLDRLMSGNFGFRGRERLVRTQVAWKQAIETRSLSKNLHSRAVEPEWTPSAPRPKKAASPPPAEERKEEPEEIPAQVPEDLPVEQEDILVNEEDKPAPVVVEKKKEKKEKIKKEKEGNKNSDTPSSSSSPSQIDNSNDPKQELLTNFLSKLVKKPTEEELRLEEERRIAAEEERLRREKEEEEARIAFEKAQEEARLAEIAEQERLEAERIAEQERFEAERLEAERLEEEERAAIEAAAAAEEERVLAQKAAEEELRKLEEEERLAAEAAATATELLDAGGAPIQDEEEELLETQQELEAKVIEPIVDEEPQIDEVEVVEDDEADAHCGAGHTFAEENVNEEGGNSQPAEEQVVEENVDEIKIDEGTASGPEDIWGDNDDA